MTDVRGAENRERPLRRGEWRVLAILGLPTFAYALATTVATTYLPVIAREFTHSNTVKGALIAIEGLMALLLAVPAGALSDRIRSRLPFVMVASPVLVLALAAMGFSSSLWFAVLITIIFFAGYFVAYEPYRAMYPDMVDNAIVGRSQSSQAISRGAGTLIALGAGGTLLALADWVPFVTGAVISGVAVLLFLRAVRGHQNHNPRADEPDRHQASLRTVFREDIPKIMRILRERADMRTFVIANALWELSLGALKTFIVLYLTLGLGMSSSASSLAMMGAALFIGIAAPVSGKLADRYGTARVMRAALVIYGIGLMIPLIFTDRAVVAAITPVFAFGGGVVMTLPFALMIPLMGGLEHGLSTGIYSVSRGIGASLGPILAGVAIGASHGLFPGTQGYQAMWAVCAASILLSIPLVNRLRHLERA